MKLANHHFSFLFNFVQKHGPLSESGIACLVDIWWVLSNEINKSTVHTIEICSIKLHRPLSQKESNSYCHIMCFFQWIQQECKMHFSNLKMCSNLIGVPTIIITKYRVIQICDVSEKIELGVCILFCCCFICFQ